MGARRGPAVTTDPDQQICANAVRCSRAAFLFGRATGTGSELGPPAITNRNISSLRWLKGIVDLLEDMMNNRLAVSLIAVSLLTSGAALGQSTTATGAVNGARAGGDVAGPVGEIVGGTVGAAVGAAVEIPNAVITSIPQREPSVTVRERVVVGEPLPPTVELRTVPSHTEYRYAVVNDRRVIVEPRTRKVIKIID
jgi:Protein of unknown function (DUF1236)